MLFIQNITKKKQYILNKIVTVKIQELGVMTKKYKHCNWQSIKQNKS